MNIYVYSAVLYTDKEEMKYFSVPDLSLLSSASDVEQAYLSIKESIKSYIELANRFNTAIPKPTPFMDICKKYPNNKVVLVDVAVSDELPELTKEEVDYKKFMKMFFDED